MVRWASDRERDPEPYGGQSSCCQSICAKASAKAGSKKKPAAVIKKPACLPAVQGDGEDGPTPAARADEDDAAAAEDDQAPAEAPLVPADAPAAAEDPNYGDLEVLPANASFRKEYRLANNSLAFRMIRIGETRTIESARGSCGS